jgi:CheY-like chemotaxis protein
MPEMDGMRASQAIRALTDIELQPRIIAMTANAMEGDRERCLQAGMDDYVSKPVRVQELVTALLRVPASSTAADVGDLEQSFAPTQQNGLSRTANTPPDPNQSTRPAAQDAEALLTALRETIGDQADGLLPELSNLFQDEGPLLLASIRKAIDDGDHQQLAAAAHTLKSSSASLGSQDLPSLCEKLETLGRSGTTIGAAEHIALLDKNYARFAAILNLTCTTLATSH